MAENNSTVEQQVKKTAWVGVYVNVLLSAIKFFLGVVGNSQAIIADAVHSLSDLSTDFAIIFGVSLWSKPADDSHPYGHHKIETVVTAAIGLILLSVAIGIGFHAVSTIHENSFEQPKVIALLGALASIVLKEILFKWTLKIGKKLRSSSLIANAWHHRTDSLSSIPVLFAVGIATIRQDWSFLDNIGAVVVSLIILKSAWGILKSVLSEVIDAGASKTKRRKIETIVMMTDGVKSVHAVRSRRMGQGWFVDLHVEVDPNITVKEGHEISAAVKYNLLQRGPNILDVVVHAEPYEK